MKWSLIGESLVPITHFGPQYIYRFMWALKLKTLIKYKLHCNIKTAIKEAKKWSRLNTHRLVYEHDQSFIEPATIFWWIMKLKIPSTKKGQTNIKGIFSFHQKSSFKRLERSADTKPSQPGSSKASRLLTKELNHLIAYSKPQCSKRN